MAQVTPIRPQAAPPPAAPPPPPAPQPAPDNSIGFAVSKPAFVIGILLSIVLALLLYLSGFFTAVALLLPLDPPPQAATASVTTPGTAPVALAKPEVPVVGSPATVAAAPAAGNDGAATSAVSTTARDEDSAATAAPAPAPPPAAPAIADTPPAPTGDTPAKRQAPVPSYLADRTSLLRLSNGSLSPPPRPTLPPPSILLRRGVDAAADAATAPPSEPPAAVAEAKQLPPTRANALLAPPPQKPAPPAGSLAWSLQIGAFLGKEHAERLLRILSDRGYEPYILETVDNRQRTWFRVRLGNYASRGLAEDAALEFERNEDREAIITRRLVDPPQPS